MDCRLVRQKIKENIVQAQHVLSSHLLVDLLAKRLKKTRVDFICDKLDIYDVCSSLRESIRKYDLYKEWYISCIRNSYLIRSHIAT